ncbi:MAG: DUF1788 domain-containing protein [Gemmatimonadaceae bacterium]|nr:DUF1788 domain-containing protein [Gemmatimonadaceae bacterium]
MGRLEDFADRYGQHIATPWQRTIAGAQRIVMLVYDKELERTLRARKSLFELETHKALHEWLEVDVTDAFATWMGADEYRDAYFESPDDLQLKLDSEFADFVATRIREVLKGASANAVVAVFGVGSLFGFVRVSHVLRAVEPDIVGRLAVFFPGQYEGNNYRLLDARDGWNYLAVPITMHGMENA